MLKDHNRCQVSQASACVRDCNFLVAVIIAICTTPCPSPSVVYGLPAHVMTLQVASYRKFEWRIILCIDSHPRWRHVTSSACVGLLSCCDTARRRPQGRVSMGSYRCIGHHCHALSGARERRRQRFDSLFSCLRGRGGIGGGPGFNAQAVLTASAHMCGACNGGVWWRPIAGSSTRD